MSSAVEGWSVAWLNKSFDGATEQVTATLPQLLDELDIGAPKRTREKATDGLGKRAKRDESLYKVENEFGDTTTNPVKDKKVKDGVYTWQFQALYEQRTKGDCVNARQLQAAIERATVEGYENGESSAQKMWMAEVRKANGKNTGEPQVDLDNDKDEMQRELNRLKKLDGRFGKLLKDMVDELKGYDLIEDVEPTEGEKPKFKMYKPKSDILDSKSSDAWNVIQNAEWLHKTRDNLANALRDMRETRGGVQLKKFTYEKLLDLRTGAHKQDDILSVILAGNSGVGKTMYSSKYLQVLIAARMVFYKDIETQPGTVLVGAFEGQTAPTVHAFIASTFQKPIILDEAYAMNQGDYGAQAVDTLTYDMNRHQGMNVIAATGYLYRMNELSEINEGFERRWAETIEIEDYDAQSLRDIFYSKAKQRVSDIKDIDFSSVNEWKQSASGVVMFALVSEFLRLATKSRQELFKKATAKVDDIKAKSKQTSLGQLTTEEWLAEHDTTMDKLVTEFDPTLHAFVAKMGASMAALANSFVASVNEMHELEQKPVDGDHFLQGIANYASKVRKPNKLAEQATIMYASTRPLTAEYYNYIKVWQSADADKSNLIKNVQTAIHLDREADKIITLPLHELIAYLMLMKDIYDTAMTAGKTPEQKKAIALKMLSLQLDQKQVTTLSLTPQIQNGLYEDAMTQVANKFQLQVPDTRASDSDSDS